MTETFTPCPLSERLLKLPSCSVFHLQPEDEVMERLGHRKACGACHRRHIKCDGRKPVCSPCEENGWSCTPSNASGRFRHDHNPTVHGSDAEKSRKKEKYSHQQWVSIPESLYFVEHDAASISDRNIGESDDTDEDEDTVAAGPDGGENTESLRIPDASLYHQTSDQRSSHAGTPNTSLGNAFHPRLSLSQGSGGGVTPASQPCSSHTLEDLPEISAVGPTLIEYPDPYEWLAQQTRDQGHNANSDHLTLDDDGNTVLDAEPTSAGLWPLASNDEAVLLRYFIIELSHWFDFCDRDRNFATTVVQASATCQTLLNAIFAVSAKHLSLRGEYDPLASDRYQRKCLQILIPALNDQCAILDSTLFAATAILRLFDEMTDPDTTRPTRGHILGTHILLRVKEKTTPTSSLRAASLLVTLRQEIFISFLTRTPVQPLADYLPIDRTAAAPADDYTWAVRMIAHASDVVTFCYGPDGNNVEKWTRLHEYLEEWERGRPASFGPFCYARGGHGTFPKIWFANDCHIGAQLYSDVCRIMLLVHDPRLPTLGLKRGRTARFVDDMIRQYVRRMCGIAMSHPHNQPATSITGMAIAMCGDRFTDREEQEKLLRILKASEEHLTWPHLKAYEELSKLWDIF